MNPRQPRANPADRDAALRQALQQSLQDTPAADHTALQDRVMAQWQQRHPAAAPALAGAHGVHLSGDRAGRLGWWLLAGGLVLAAALALGWANRSDPVLDELMQPDVLSQIGLGEL
jgi:type VI protein secretion system component VasF